MGVTGDRRRGEGRNREDQMKIERYSTIKTKKKLSHPDGCKKKSQSSFDFDFPDV